MRVRHRQAKQGLGRAYLDGFGVALAGGAGTVVGILAAQLLAKQLRPPDPDLHDGAIDPAEFGALPAGRATPASGVPAPMAPVPATQPVEVLSGLLPGGGAAPASAAAPASDDDSSSGDKKAD